MKKSKKVDTRDYVDRIEAQEMISAFAHHRTIEFYLRMGLLDKGERLPNDRRVFWRRDYLFDELKAIDFLSSFDIVLPRIAKLAQKTNYKLRDIVEDLQQLIHGMYLPKKMELFKKYSINSLITYKDAQPIVEAYVSKVFENGQVSQAEKTYFETKLVEYLGEELEHEKVKKAVIDKKDDDYMTRVSKKIVDEHKRDSIDKFKFF